MSKNDVFKGPDTIFFSSEFNFHPRMASKIFPFNFFLKKKTLKKDWLWSPWLTGPLGDFSFPSLDRWERGKIAERTGYQSQRRREDRRATLREFNQRKKAVALR